MCITLVGYEAMDLTEHLHIVVPIGITRLQDVTSIIVAHTKPLGRRSF